MTRSSLSIIIFLFALFRLSQLEALLSFHKPRCSNKFQLRHFRNYEFKLASVDGDVDRTKIGGGNIQTGTCRICKTSFFENGPRSCRYHPGSMRGESARKGNWEGTLGSEGQDSGELVYSWTCCGGAADDAGCTYGTHKTYDDL